jgi:hypothetical protein
MPLSVYPLLLGTFPVVALVLQNMGSLSPSAAWGGLAAATAGVGGLWIVTRLALRNSHKADLITAITGMMFFSYGHLLRAVYTALILASDYSFRAIVRSERLEYAPSVLKAVFAVWGLLVLLSIVLLLRTSADLRRAAQAFHYVGVAVFVVTLGNWLLARAALPNAAAGPSAWRRQLEATDFTSVRCPRPQPDIYYIILDAYAREDVLEAFYDVDNSAFIAFLADLGFFVGDQSHANYVQTPLSMASSLNFSYLDPVVTQAGETPPDWARLREMILDSKISAYLRHCGYTIVAFSSGFGATEMTSADVYLAPKVALSDFQNELLNLTPVPTVSLLFSLTSQYEIHRQRILYIFDQLPQVRNQVSGPFFAFAHINSPHPPFVFDSQGHPVESTSPFGLDQDFFGNGADEYITQYREQLLFISDRVRDTLPAILSPTAGRPQPIVLIQSDHGPSSQVNWEQPGPDGLWERTAILNAYYFPDGDYSQLTRDVSPVNSFRIVLNKFFGARLPVLEQKAFFSTQDEPYLFQQVGGDE